ncbi:MAG: hypothetical protein JXB32_18430, partial [Deltaproteobacteria bacterium]|nr:hypothetical protein [Deltaproteobacteria bacterium]
MRTTIPERSPAIAFGAAARLPSRLQDFFGLVEGPRIADGRVPLVLHLLAPS